MKLRILLVLVGALAAALLACGSPLPIGGPTPAYAPVPVSSEAVQSLTDKFNSLGVASGEVTVSITESELTSYLNSQLEAQPESAFSNPQVYLRDGRMWLYATLTTEQVTGNAEVVLNAAITGNSMVVTIDRANFGPVPAPANVLDSIAATVNDNLLALFGGLPTGVGLKSISIADGQMTLTAVVK